MKTIHLALVSAAALALAACGSQQDEEAIGDNLGENLQADELNALAENAAQDAQSEMQALENQQQQLEEAPANESATANAAADVTTEPSEVEDEPLGM